MRYQPAHKSRTRDRILEEARRAFLSDGRNGTGVDGVMKSAGLTAGGFYSHFESKDALFEHALEHAFERSIAIFFRDLDKLDGRNEINVLTRRYLSRDHRDNVREGCPLPALAADVARAGGKSRAIFESNLNELVKRMAPAFARNGELDAREQALALLALYVGGTVLARATRGSPLSDRLLVACRKQARTGSRIRRKRTRKTP